MVLTSNLLQRFMNRGHIYNASFSSEIMNGPNKLECYISLDQKCLPGVNALACWASLKVAKKIIVMNNAPGCLSKLLVGGLLS